jgi:hypothetical protein
MNQHDDESAATGRLNRRLRRATHHGVSMGLRARLGLWAGIVAISMLLVWLPFAVDTVTSNPLTGLVLTLLTALLYPFGFGAALTKNPAHWAALGFVGYGLHLMALVMILRVSEPRRLKLVISVFVIVCLVTSYGCHQMIIDYGSR